MCHAPTLFLLCHFFMRVVVEKDTETDYYIWRFQLLCTDKGCRKLSPNHHSWNMPRGSSVIARFAIVHVVFIERRASVKKICLRQYIKWRYYFITSHTSLVLRKQQESPPNFDISHIQLIEAWRHQSLGWCPNLPLRNWSTLELIGAYMVESRQVHLQNG